MIRTITKPSIIFLIFCYIFTIPLTLESANLRENDIKAVFLFNFTKFITWPEQAFNNTNSLFNICILGKNPFGNSLDKLIKNEMIDEHPIALEVFEDIEQTEGCHILYITDSKKHDLDNIFTFIKGKSVLTVSDIKRFTKKGGMIEFFKQKRKIRFYIVPKFMRDVKLIPNSNLLRVAKIVKP